MQFETEAQLVDQLHQVYGTALGSDWVWLREFSTSCGIADLIGVSLAPVHSTSAISRASLGLVPSGWAYTLQRLPSQVPFTLGDLAELANVSTSSARSILKVFNETGFCAPVGESKAWVKAFDPTPVAKRIVAVEAKLRDWRRALYQAVQHADYATQCWVVLDQTSLGNAQQHDEEFENRGVGLAGLSSDGDIEVIVNATERIPRLPYRFWQANAEIARRLM
jgi:hypothetical protein